MLSYAFFENSNPIAWALLFAINGIFVVGLRSLTRSSVGGWLGGILGTGLVFFIIAHMGPSVNAMALSDQEIADLDRPFSYEKAFPCGEDGQRLVYINSKHYVLAPEDRVTGWASHYELTQSEGWRETALRCHQRYSSIF